MFVNANEGYRNMTPPPTVPNVTQLMFQPSVATSLLRLADLVGYQVNGGYHAENLPNKKGPYLRIPSFSEKRE